jgi:hypothetical protein
MNKLTCPLASLLVALVLTGCAGAPSINALHDPLYRAESHTSTITVRATETRDGIAEITISAIVGELTACESMSPLVPSLIPCRANAVGMGAVCIFPNVKTQVSCSLPIALGDRRLVTYTASTRTAANRTATASAVTLGDCKARHLAHRRAVDEHQPRRQDRPRPRARPRHAQLPRLY